MSITYSYDERGMVFFCNGRYVQGFHMTLRQANAAGSARFSDEAVVFQITDELLYELVVAIDPVALDRELRTTFDEGDFPENPDERSFYSNLVLWVWLTAKDAVDEYWEDYMNLTA